MKKIIISIVILVTCFASLVSQDIINGSQLNDDPAQERFAKLPSGCTVFTISRGGSVFFGGNDDYINPDSYFWIDKGDEKNYGVIWIGQPDNVQQGVNEKGLAYDANGLPRVDVNPHTERIPVSGGYTSYPIYIMHECATVDEVISWINAHQWHSYMHDQMQFADAKGDAVIISAGKDGELVFTRKPSGDGFLVSTNFNVANTANSYGYPCWRYEKAQELLGQLLSKKEQLTPLDATNILEAVHMERGASWTIESLVADLVNGVIYLYYYYQYDHPVVLNVKDELSNPGKAGPLSSLFPDDVQQEASRRYNQAQAGARLGKVIGISWIGIILVSLVLLFSFTDYHKKGMWFWITTVIVFGPIGLLAKILAAPNQREYYWKTAMVETIGNIIPIVVSYTLALVVIILATLARGTSWQLQIAAMFGLPLITGWLIFHGLFLAHASTENFGRFLIHRLPQVLVTTFLGLAGTFAISMPLVSKSLNISQLLPLSPWAVVTWWAIVVLSALFGGLLIFFYERWAVKRSFVAWSILAGNPGKVITPSWRRLWWWILISSVVLFAGLITGVMLNKIL